jgi:YfiH family protein
MRRITHNDMVFYQFETLTDQGKLDHGLFTRLGGVSAPPFDTLNVGSTVGDDPASVQANRERVAGAMGLREVDTRTTWQVHGRDVLVARQAEAPTWPPPKADGIITADRGVPLVMRFADCVPLVFFDPVKQAIGLSHAGWRGTLSGIGPATVNAMHAAFGSRPQDIVAGVGPSIGPCCYQVGQEVIEQVQKVFDDSKALIRPLSSGEGAFLDLWAANEQALRLAGVLHIELAGLCTACHSHEFYSHRAANGNTGRFAVVLQMNRA